MTDEPQPTLNELLRRPRRASPSAEAFYNRLFGSDPPEPEPERSGPDNDTEREEEQ